MVAAADILLRYGVHPDQRCPSGSTALVLACLNGRTACVRLLLGLPHSLSGPMMVTTKRAPQAARVHGDALVQACRGVDEHAAEEITAELLKADWNLVIQPSDGDIAAHAAAASGFPRVLVS